MKQFKLWFTVLIAFLLAVVTLLLNCDRLNLYDMASGKSRTAYAVANDGTNYFLIIANINFSKLFKIIPAFLVNPAGISINQKGELITWDATNTYKIQGDLSSWTAISNSPGNHVIASHDKFYTYNATQIDWYDEMTSSWNYYCQPDASYNSYLFQGYNGDVYGFYNNSTDYSFFRVTSSCSEPLTNASFSPNGTFITAYKTRDAFYLGFSSYINSVFKISSGTVIEYNKSTFVGNSLVDLSVTDDGNIFIISDQGGSNFALKKFLSPETIITLLSIGAGSYCNIDTLDNNHLIIATNGISGNYNGLFIYNIEDSKIEKYITTMNIIALYVPR